ncbi:hypothetical protein ASN_2375 [Acetobacter senegalensis]|uniref:NERD domain-containing protein n=1 Tax=Acetobacter senegalensis TaxID=446692 RepID=A0A0U5EZX9_9PROT|nr:hypothetical protein ASN_2375 [Acetobacter senegalensis]
MRRRYGAPMRSARENSFLKAFKSDIQGRKGETNVRNILAEYGLPSLHDIVLPTRSGNPTQIDHVALTAFGILVIETKHLQGRLSGDIRNDYWRQTLPGGWSEKIYSPVRQNAGHCDAVYMIVRHIDSRIQTLSRIVMTGTAEVAPALSSVVHTSETFAKELESLRNNSVSELLQHAWDRLTEAAKHHEGLRKGTTLSPFA